MPRGSGTISFALETGTVTIDLLEIPNQPSYIYGKILFKIVR